MKDLIRHKMKKNKPTFNLFIRGNLNGAYGEENCGAHTRSWKKWKTYPSPPEMGRNDDTAAKYKGKVVDELSNVGLMRSLIVEMNRP